MKRRDFLKILGTYAVVPGAVIVAIKAKPKPVISIDPSKPHRWKNYYAEYKPNAAQKRILLEKFRKAFKNTKFKRPINAKLIVIDESDHTIINFLKEHGIKYKTL